MFSTFIVPVALALFASSAVSSPYVVPFPTNKDFEYNAKWQITNFRFECYTQPKQNCEYSFDVESTDSADNQRHLLANCMANGAQFNDQRFVDCSNYNPGSEVHLVRSSLPLRPIAQNVQTQLRIQVMFGQIAAKTNFYEAYLPANYGYWKSISDGDFPMSPLKPHFISDLTGEGL